MIMKKDFLKGHPLAEKEMREVKGGTIVIPTVGAPGACSICGNRSYDYENGIYACKKCGCVKSEDELENVTK